MNGISKHTPRLIEALLGFFNDQGLVEYEDMPSTVTSVASRAIDQFPRASFSKRCREFLRGEPVHPRAITDAADRLLSEGDAWVDERDDWDAARTYVQRLDRLRSAMVALREAAAAFDEQADELRLCPADRNTLFSAAIAKATGEQS